ncbi:MaoC family dehydratase (plasmid) [Rhodococcus globerulus]|uniref:MaoC family dehydratase n=1 Tax=Rhodococcus globerulus TaxID=33008 RepID=UPI0039ECA0A1
MLVVDSVSDLAPNVGTVLGRSDWVPLRPELIASFGEVTGDEHWMHVDRDRAREESPFGDVIAHGFLLLSLVTGLGNQCYDVRRVRQWTNYGLERVRFTAPVTASDSVRLVMTLDELIPTATGAKLILGCELELENSSRPAMVAQWIVLTAEGSDHE